MSLIKYNPFKPFRPDTVDHFINDFAGRSLSEFFGSEFVSATPSVNVIENEDSFVIKVAAPGLSKDDFIVDLDNGLLSISANKEISSEENNEGEFTRREFNYASFKRSFHLSDDILKDDISAAYDSGILSITLIKKEETKTTIDIS